MRVLGSIVLPLAALMQLFDAESAGVDARRIIGPKWFAQRRTVWSERDAALASKSSTSQKTSVNRR